MRDAGRHGTERAETFALDEMILRVAQFGEGFAQLRGTFAHAVLQERLLVAELQMLVPRFEQILDAQQHLDGVERLGEKIRGADGQRATLGFEPDVGGQHEDGHALRRHEILRELLHHAEAVEVRHVQVEQDEVGLARLTQREHPARIGRGDDLRVTAELEQVFEERDVHGLVVDDEEPHAQ